MHPPPVLSHARTCESKVTAVYYDGKRVPFSGDRKKCADPKRLDVSYISGAVLAISGRDSQGGEEAGFFLSCCVGASDASGPGSSPRRGFEEGALSASTAVVLGARVAASESADVMANSGWEKNDFDDVNWVVSATGKIWGGV